MIVKKISKAEYNATATIKYAGMTRDMHRMCKLVNVSHFYAMIERQK